MSYNTDVSLVTVPVTHKCGCNPCPNFDDICQDAVDVADERICNSVPDSTGTPFTLLFMQNRPDDTENRELVSEEFLSQ